MSCFVLLEGEGETSLVFDEKTKPKKRHELTICSQQNDIQLLRSIQQTFSGNKFNTRQNTLK